MRHDAGRWLLTTGVVLVFKVDRSFKSVKHLHDNLADWETMGVGVKSLCEKFDPSTVPGRLLC